MDEEDETSMQVVSEEALSMFVVMRTIDVLRDGQVCGFIYQVKTEPEREVSFHVDLIGSENLCLENEGLLTKSLVPAGSDFVPVARVEVKDLESPWSLQCRYAWTEREKTVLEIDPDVFLEVTDLWSKGRAVTAIEYKLDVKCNKRIDISLSFEGSTNLELATGGLLARAVVEPFSVASIAYLQVIEVSRPWRLTLKYDWSPEEPQLPVMDHAGRQELAPGLSLLSTRTSSSAGEFFTYQVACSKNMIIHFTLDCTGSTNVRLENDELVQRTKIRPWDREDIGIVKVVDPSKPWSLRIKLSWSELAVKVPSFISESKDTLPNIVSHINIELDSSAEDQSPKGSKKGSMQKSATNFTPQSPAFVANASLPVGAQERVDLESFLTSISLGQHLERFQSEQVDWALLKEMAKDEECLREMLKELGISIGHREKIIINLRTYFNK
mmetsp:Transcript_17287/g.31748  ORF Transcript_17287/g.31748 Transcript_17287/m.31748 type:complete len:441 (+) Transcript_17287:342-1664(+)